MVNLSEIATKHIAAIESELLAISKEMEERRRLKEAWEIIRDNELAQVEQEREETQAAFETVASIEERQRQEEAEAAGYGNKSRAVRQAIVESGVIGMTRQQVIEFAKGLNAHKNFAYKFIERMLATEELVEESGILKATNRMKSRVRMNAA